MRADFCDAIQEGEYLEDCKNLLYEHYLNLSSENQYGEIPYDIADQIKRNYTYGDARNKLISLGMDLPAQLKEEYLHSPEDIKDLITEDSIKIYMERFRVVRGEETYIPVRPDMQCPAELIATSNDKKVNIFTFNNNTKTLALMKNVGKENDFIVNILVEGDHFIRLYNPAESDHHHSQAKQIMKNYIRSIGNRWFGMG